MDIRIRRIDETFETISINDLKYLFRDIGGKEGMIAIRNGSLIVVPARPLSFTLWKSFTHRGISITSLLKRLLAHGVCVDSVTRELCANPTYSLGRNTISARIAKVSVGELGFTNETTYGEICARAYASGLSECTIEMALLLRLAYMEQPPEEKLCVAMREMRLAAREYIFSLERNTSGEHIFRSTSIRKRMRCFPEMQFAFQMR